MKKIIFAFAILSFFVLSEPKAEEYFEDDCLYLRHDDGDWCDPEGNTCIVITPRPESGLCEEG